MRPSRPPAAPPAPTPGTPFGGLILLERVGVGGMAEVFRAREPKAAGEARTIVLKRMLPHIAAEPGAARMFEAEARIGRLVEHPNVVQVLGSGAADGLPYLCLELVPGLDLGRLRRWLEHEHRRLSLELTLFIGHQLLSGLEAVHEARGHDGSPLGIVHHDVSPSNVLVSTRGEVKLADFGVAQQRLRESFPQAAAGARTHGKLAYLSPEQVRGEPTDRRSDVFAASALIAELVLGAPLFARDGDLATLLAVREARVDPLAAAELPPGLAEILAGGLARAPKDRFPSASALDAAIRPFLRTDPAALARELGDLIARACASSAELAPRTEDEITIEPPLTGHHVRTTDGRQLGPWTFAQLVEAVTLGQLAPDDRIRTGSAWRAVREIGGLAEHLPSARRRDTLAADELDLTSGRIIEALARSAAQRATGVWICSLGDVRKEIYLVEGTPAFVTSNVASELLGEHLVSRGALTRGELEMALAILPRFDGRLGDTLAALGLMEPVDLLRHLGDQVREKLLSLFTWEHGRARFIEGEPPPKRGFPLGLDPWAVLLEGIERRLAAGLEQETFAPHLTDDLLPGPQPVPPGAPADLEQLAALVPRPLQELVELLDAPARDGHRAYRLVRLGLALGIVAWAP